MSEALASPASIELGIAHSRFPRLSPPLLQCLWDGMEALGRLKSPVLDREIDAVTILLQQRKIPLVEFMDYSVLCEYCTVLYCTLLYCS